MFRGPQPPTARFIARRGKGVLLSMVLAEGWEDGLGPLATPPLGWATPTQ